MGVFDCGEDQVFSHFFFVWIEDGRVNVQTSQVSLGCCRGFNQAGTRFTNNHDGVQVLLDLLHLRLHLFGFFHHAGHIAKPAKSFKHRCLLFCAVFYLIAETRVSIVLKRIPFIFDFWQCILNRLCSDLFWGADGFDFGLWKLG